MEVISEIMERIVEKYGSNANLNIDCNLYCLIYIGDVLNQTMDVCEKVVFSGTIDEIINHLW